MLDNKTVQTTCMTGDKSQRNDGDGHDDTCKTVHSPLTLSCQHAGRVCNNDNLIDGTVYDMYAASTGVECKLSAKGQPNSHTATGSLSGENELLWPWESNGCSEYGEGVVHIDLVTREGI